MPPNAPPGAGRILLCDDAVAFPLLFERWMVDCGLDLVGRADTAEEALVLAEREQPDVIVVDHLLREVTSEGLAPQLRQVAPAARLLLISGMADDHLAIAAEAANADAFISKAASGPAMCDAVRALVPLH